MSRRKYQAPRSKVVAALLAFFFGSFGMQKFYLRQGGIGVIMILSIIFTGGATMPFLFVFGIFDAIRLLNMSEEDFNIKYNRYSSRIRRDDYLEQRKERQKQKARGRLPAQRKRSKSQPPKRVIAKVNPFKNSGLKKYKQYDMDGAIEDFEEGLKINPDDIALNFNLACAFSMTEQKDKAYQHLSKAVSLGFDDFEMINTKDDLAFVRIQPEFEQFKANGYKIVEKKSSPAINAPNTQDELDINDDVLLSQLNKLAELRKKGLLSEEEFMFERKRLLER